MTLRTSSTLGCMLPMTAMLGVSSRMPLVLGLCFALTGCEGGMGRAPSPSRFTEDLGVPVMADGAVDSGLRLGACAGRTDGDYCDGDTLVRCRGAVDVGRSRCDGGCSAGSGGPDACALATPTPTPTPTPTCGAIPPTAETSPPSDACAYMDWRLSTDGFYLISRFGTTEDSTTLGHGTTCRILQRHYDYQDCVYDNATSRCIASAHDIPWVQGHVDYDAATLLSTVDARLGGDVPAPEYFYVAGAQRFGCGATLRVSNPATGACVVAYAEDGGPGTRYEYADRGGRRILDSSPAVVRYLGVTRWGWASADLVLVEWGEPGDVPGHACVPCAGESARAGTEARRAIYDPDHMMPTSCR